MKEYEALKKYIEFINSLNLSFDKKSEEYGYENPVILLMDATLSINRRYNNFVLPRIEYFKKAYSNTNTLEKLNNLIKEKGLRGFQNVWNYKHPKRVEILRNLTKFFLQYKNENNIKDDLKAMRHWAQNVDLSSKKILPVDGIGFATSQYVRKMLGVDSVKPDVHIKKSIFEGTKEKISDRKTVLFVEKAAKEMDVTATALDYAIWKYYSLK